MGIVSDAVDDALRLYVEDGTLTMIESVMNCVHEGLVPGALSSFPLMGVVITLIDHTINYSFIRTFCLSELFTYPNFSLIRTNF